MTKQSIAEKLEAHGEALTLQFTKTSDALKEVQDAETQASNQRVALTNAKNKVLVQYADDAKALGSNEASRNARIDELCATELESSRMADNSLKQASNYLAVQQLMLDSHKRQLNVLQSIASLLASE